MARSCVMISLLSKLDGQAFRAQLSHFEGSKGTSMSVRFVVVTFLMMSGVAYAQTLSDAQVAGAIKSGESRKFDHLMTDCMARAGMGESIGAGMSDGLQRNGRFKITVSTNEGRIAFLAADAKRLYKTVHRGRRSRRSPRSSSGRAD